MALLGQEPARHTGHIDTRRVDKHMKPPVETDFLVENPSARGFATLPPPLHTVSGRLPTAHCHTPRQTRFPSSSRRGRTIAVQVIDRLQDGQQGDALFASGFIRFQRQRLSTDFDSRK
jgi:hypothetical protein